MPSLLVILTGKRTGDNRQLRDVARATLLRVEEIKLDVANRPSALLAAFPQIFGSSQTHQHLLSLENNSIVLVAEAAACAAALRARRSGGQFKLACIGRPRGHIDDFDLIISSPHFAPPPSEKIRVLPFPPHSPVQMPSGPATDLPDEIIDSTLCLVGGPSGPDMLDATTAKRLAEDLITHQIHRQKKCFVLTSPRTPAPVVSILKAALPKPDFSVLSWQPQVPSPYAAALAKAGKFIVTSDSVSMLVECMLTHKPCYVYELPQHADYFLRAVEYLWRNNRASWLFNSGLIEPRADRRRLFAELLARNHIRMFGQAWPADAVPAQSTVGEAARLIRELANQPG